MASEIAAARRRRFREDVRATWEIVAFPVQTLRRVLPRSPILVPWLAVSLLTMALSLPQISIAQRAAAHLLEDRATAEHREAVSRSLSSMKLFAVAGAPVSVLTRWTVVAAVLWAPAALFSSALPFRRVLSIVALAGVPSVLGQGIDLAVAWTDGPQFTPDLVPVNSSATSLSAILPTGVGSPWLAAALDNLTPFSLWAVALWAAGLRIGGRLRRPVAVSIAVAAGAGLLVLTASADVIGRSLLAATGPPG